LLKPPERFREPFSVSNSDAAILRFPFPFRSDRFEYGVNLEPHGQPGASPAYDAVFDVDEHYLGEVAEREIVLRGDSSRYAVPEDMREAAWETLALVMTALAKDFPHWFELAREGDSWRWRNHALQIEKNFVFGDDAALPGGPLAYVARQAQGDFVLLEQREDTLFMQGGLVTAAAGWSFARNLGKSFHQFHEPVPLAHKTGVFDRAQKVLARLSPQRPVRRVGWGVTAQPRLDISVENEAAWALNKSKVTAADVARRVWLRVELQTLTRLPRSQAILFCIRTYMLRLDELARVRKWAARLHRVLGGLHPDVVAYKGLGHVLPLMLGYLAPYDDGGALGAGAGPEQTSL